MNGQRKSYSKSGPIRKSQSSRMFDMVIGPVQNFTESSVQTLNKIKLRNKSKKTQPKRTVKQLSVVAENEASKSRIDSETKTHSEIDEETKRRRIQGQDRSDGKKQAQKPKSRRRNFTKRDSVCSKRTIDDQSAVSPNPVRKRVQTRHSNQVGLLHDANLAKLKSKTISSVQQWAITEENKNMMTVEIDRGNRWQHTNLDSSIEVARDSISISTKTPPFREKFSPVSIKETVKHSSEGITSSELENASDNSLVISMSRVCDVESMSSTADLGTSKSSKYTYSYVSTDTFGMSCHSTAKEKQSPFVPMKKLYSLNSTPKPHKENIKEVEFPASISSIHCSSETTPEKRVAMSNCKLQRYRKKTGTERLKLQPQKCSTMLFSEETSDSYFGFPLTLTKIADIDSNRSSSDLFSQYQGGAYKPVNSTRLMKEDLCKRKSSKGGESLTVKTTLSQVQKKRKDSSFQGNDIANNENCDIQTEIVRDVSSNDFKAAREVVGLTESNSCREFVSKTSDGELKSTCQVEKVGQVTREKGNTKNNFDVFKNLKKKTLKNRSSKCKRNKQHAILSEAEPSKMQASWQHSDFIEHPEACQLSTTKFSKMNTSGDEIQAQAVPIAKHGVEICCVNRLFMSYYTKNIEGELSLTLFNKS